MRGLDDVICLVFFQLVLDCTSCLVYCLSLIIMIMRRRGIIFDYNRKFTSNWSGELRQHLFNNIGSLEVVLKARFLLL